MMRPTRRVLFVTALAAVAGGAAGCWREKREFRGAPAAAARFAPVRIAPLQPGPPQPDDVQVGPYEDNAWAIAEGQRLYNWYNCSGCHFHAGGGIGPPLMDDEWIYGSDPQNIHDTIVAGRPNGMPSFGGHVPDDQIWKIVAYVRSLSGLERPDTTPPRSDALETGSQLQPPSR
jgi:cytochrome c oxidase cbb3-type subunit III